MKKKIVLISTFILLIVQNVSSNTVHVIDGDTIKIGNKKIRFSGIDAPELNQYCFKNGKKILCGVLAKKALVKKIGNKVPKCVIEGKDRYKRILAECFINEKSLSKFLVRNGYAFAYRKYSKKFIQDEEVARKNKLGLWSMKFDYPWEFRKL
tara:strand:- start:154 stop:609 length:456 start_codon:yes stop_codon:yes gene_type:complete